MIAQPIRVLDPLNPVPAVAFGDFVDFARYLRSRSAADVCDACNTINPASATFCKGCSGKMPAFYAAMERHRDDTPAKRSAVAAVRSHRGLAFMAYGLAGVLLVLGAAFGPWLVGATLMTYLEPHDRQVPAAMAAAQEADFEPVSMVFDRDSVPLDAGAGAGEVAAPLFGNTDAEPSPRPSVAARTEHRAVPAGAPLQPRAPVARTPRGGTVTSTASIGACGDLDFLSRAICLNNRCAQGALSHSAQCAPVLRQRRIDEARRNPLLAG